MPKWRWWFCGSNHSDILILGWCHLKHVLGLFVVEMSLSITKSEAIWIWSEMLPQVKELKYVGLY